MPTTAEDKTSDIDEDEDVVMKQPPSTTTMIKASNATTATDIAPQQVLSSFDDSLDPLLLSDQPHKNNTSAKSSKSKLSATKTQQPSTH